MAIATVSSTNKTLEKSSKQFNEPRAANAQLSALSCGKMELTKTKKK